MMTLQLFAHPFSSYCQKVLIALYENGTPFEQRMLTPDNQLVGEEFARLWPIKRGALHGSLFRQLRDDPDDESRV